MITLPILILIVIIPWIIVRKFSKEQKERDMNIRIASCVKILKEELDTKHTIRNAQRVWMCMIKMQTIRLKCERKRLYISLSIINHHIEHYKPLAEKITGFELE